MERVKACPDTAAVPSAATGRSPSGRIRKESSTVAERAGGPPEVCAGRRVLLAGGSPVGPAPSGVRGQRRGNASPGAGRSENENGMQARLDGSGRWAPVWETAGINLVMRGWLAYFTAFYPTAVRPLCQRIDRHLMR